MVKILFHEYRKFLVICLSLSLISAVNPSALSNSTIQWQCDTYITSQDGRRCVHRRSGASSCTRRRRQSVPAESLSPLHRNPSLRSCSSASLFAVCTALNHRNAWKKKITDTLQSATEQALQWGGMHSTAHIWDTYGGRDAGEDEEAQDRRVQGAVGADDPEHRPLVGVLEDGADLWSMQIRFRQ